MKPPDRRDPADDMDLMAYVDGTLPPEDRARVEARLARDPEARDSVAAWRHYDNLIHDAGRGADALPENLKIAALERQLAKRLEKRRWRALLLGPRLRQVAASVVIFAAGWGAHGLIGADGAMRAELPPGFVGPTLAGHYAYVHAAHQRAEFSGDQMAEAVAWLSNEMQQRIESPRLERLGYEIESARLQVVDDTPYAIFYYRNAEDERVTVSMTPRLASQPDYEFRIARTESDRVAYWSTGNLYYAVVASGGADTLTTLAAAVEE